MSLILIIAAAAGVIALSGGKQKKKKVGGGLKVSKLSLEGIDQARKGKAERDDAKSVVKALGVVMVEAAKASAMATTRAKTAKTAAAKAANAVAGARPSVDPARVLYLLRKKAVEENILPGAKNILIDRMLDAQAAWQIAATRLANMTKVWKIALEELSKKETLAARAKVVLKEASDAWNNAKKKLNAM